MQIQSLFDVTSITAQLVVCMSMIRFVVFRFDDLYRVRYSTLSRSDNLAFICFHRVGDSSLTTRYMQTHMPVCGSQVKATRPSRTTRSMAVYKGACTSLLVVVGYWRTTISIVIH